jgi:uncharacterized protein YdhG (YjbR/CyaY superfamily)
MMKKKEIKDPEKMPPAKDVDTYLAVLPDDTRIVLEKLRQTIKSAAPKAEETISYRIPAYKFHGPLVFFAAFKGHCSLFVTNSSVLETFKKELEPFQITGTTIHFSPENPLPASLVKKIVRVRMKENEAVKTKREKL